MKYLILLVLCQQILKVGFATLSPSYAYMKDHELLAFLFYMAFVITSQFISQRFSSAAKTKLEHCYMYLDEEYRLCLKSQNGDGNILMLNSSSQVGLEFLENFYSCSHSRKKLTVTNFCEPGTSEARLEYRCLLCGVDFITTDKAVLDVLLQYKNQRIPTGAITNSESVLVKLVPHSFNPSSDIPVLLILCYWAFHPIILFGKMVIEFEFFWRLLFITLAFILLLKSVSHLFQHITFKPDLEVLIEGIRYKVYLDEENFVCLKYKSLREDCELLLKSSDAVGIEFLERFSHCSYSKNKVRRFWDVGIDNQGQFRYQCPYCEVDFVTTEKAISEIWSLYKEQKACDQLCTASLESNSSTSHDAISNTEFKSAIEVEDERQPEKTLWSEKMYQESKEFCSKGNYKGLEEYILNTQISPATIYENLQADEFTVVQRHVMSLAAIAAGGDPNWSDPLSQNQTPLHSAVCFASLSFVNSLMERGVDINALTSDKKTPLIIALEEYKKNPDERFLNIADNLLDMEADVDVGHSSESENPVELALSLTEVDFKQTLGLVNKMVAKTTKKDKGSSFLLKLLKSASQEGKLDNIEQRQNLRKIVEQLIEVGDVNKGRGDLGRSALHIACACYPEDAVDLANLLLKKEAKINNMTHRKETPLLVALQLLKERKEEGYIDVVILLLKRDADVSIGISEDCDDMTAVQILCSCNFEIQEEKISELVKLLQKSESYHFIAWNDLSESQMTPLILALENAQEEKDSFAAIFLNELADLNPYMDPNIGKGSGGKAALHLACIVPNLALRVKIVKWLICVLGANVNCQDENKKTPLDYLLANEGNEELVKIVILAGVDPEELCNSVNSYNDILEKAGLLDSSQDEITIPDQDHSNSIANPSPLYHDVRCITTVAGGSRNDQTNFIKAITSYSSSRLSSHSKSPIVRKCTFHSATFGDFAFVNAPDLGLLPGLPQFLCHTSLVVLFCDMQKERNCRKVLEIFKSFGNVATALHIVFVVRGSTEMGEPHDWVHELLSKGSLKVSSATILDISNQPENATIEYIKSMIQELMEKMTLPKLPPKYAFFLNDLVSRARQIGEQRYSYNLKMLSQYSSFFDSSFAIPFCQGLNSTGRAVFYLEQNNEKRSRLVLDASAEISSLMESLLHQPVISIIPKYTTGIYAN